VLYQQTPQKMAKGRSGAFDSSGWVHWLTKRNTRPSTNKQNPILTRNSLGSRGGDNEKVFLYLTPYSPVDITYVTEKSISFHLKPECKDVSRLMIEKDMPTCLPVVWRHTPEDNLEFEQGNEYGDRTWAAADTQTCFLHLKTFQYLR
jgi:hypothetical protein